eukprot:TRINITY_DN11276_c0_g1_i1.p1 TRINITY_DN11276_c0_g1~~TRINITY_DN11276_c0_g1_i1.p1  ORF type:complete len:701 (-),score=111.33 TRINITY_DN11276_c0_g1_i1:26-2128(-)
MERLPSSPALRELKDLTYDSEVGAFTVQNAGQEFKDRIKRRERRIRSNLSARSKDLSSPTSPGEGDATLDTEEDVSPELPERLQAELPSRRRISVLQRFKTMADESSEDVRNGKIPLVEHMLFDAAIAVLIVINALIVGLEVDMDLGIPGDVIKNIICVIWLLEVIAKLWTYGLKGYFCNLSNLFDFALALFALSDFWGIQQLWPESSTKLSSISTVRILRVFRLVRVVRLLKMFRALWLLVLGLVKACAALCWVMILIVVMIYSFAILFTLLVGKECDNASGPFFHWDECYDFYGTMPKSMLSLFEVMTLELGSVRPMIVAEPWLELPMIAFIVTTSFGLLNIIMGIIVDQVLESASYDKRMIAKQEEEQHLLQLETLRDIFQAADSDKDCRVSLSEFVHACTSSEVQALFEEFGVPVSRQRLATRLFQVLDGEGLGNMALNDFVDRAASLLKEGKMVNADATLLLMDVRALERHLNRFEQSTVASLKDINDNLTSLSKAMVAPDQPVKSMEPFGTQQTKRTAQEQELTDPTSTQQLLNGNGVAAAPTLLVDDPALWLTTLENKSLPIARESHLENINSVNTSYQKPSLAETSESHLLEDLKHHILELNRKLAEQDLQLLSTLRDTVPLRDVQTVTEKLQSQLTQLGASSATDFEKLESRLGARLTTEVKRIESTFVSELISFEGRFAESLVKQMQRRT